MERVAEGLSIRRAQNQAEQGQQSTRQGSASSGALQTNGSCIKTLDREAHDRIPGIADGFGMYR